MPLNFTKRLTRQTFQNQKPVFPRTATTITLTFHAKLVNIKTILLLETPPLTLTQNKMGNFEIIDSHLHVFDLNVKANFPNQNRSHEFPNQDPIIRNISQEYAKEIANKSGVKKVVFVMCYDDCPEEAQWVYDNAQNTGSDVFSMQNLENLEFSKI